MGRDATYRTFEARRATGSYRGEESDFRALGLGSRARGCLGLWTIRRVCEVENQRGEEPTQCSEVLEDA